MSPLIDVDGDVVDAEEGLAVGTRCGFVVYSPVDLRLILSLKLMLQLIALSLLNYLRLVS